MPSRARLTSETIVAAAMDLVDTEGVEAFSMRNLAARLNVDPMAIYHHHKNKNALIHALVGEFIGQCAIPSPSADWRDDLRAICRNFRALGHKHPGVFLLYVYHEDWLATEFDLFEAMLATLLRAGFSPTSAVRSMRMALIFIECFVEDELNGWMEEGDIAHVRKMVSDGQYTALQGALTAFVTYEHDEEFENGVEVLINGFDAALKA